MHILIWLGAKKINIVGCDLSGKKGDYYDEKINLKPENKKWNKTTYNEINKFLSKLVPIAEQQGVKISSCTPDSRINEYMNYISIDKALEKTQKLVPFGGHLYHSSEVDKFK